MSALYDELREAGGVALAWTVHIQFPQFEEFDELNLYYTTAQNLDIGDGNIYLPLLSSVKGRHQSDRGNDYAEFSLLNPNHSTYQDFITREDLIEKAVVIINECLGVGDDFYEPEYRFKGYLADFTQNDSSKTLDFTAYSDMSRQGIKVGGLILTRERCRHEFNYMGLKDPDTDGCGWQVAQGGNPVYCSRYLKGIDGCEAHNNEHRFGAVTGLVDTPIQIIPPEQFQYPTGFDYETAQCFSANTLVVMADGREVPINKVKIGDKVLGFDIFDKDKIVESEVIKTFTHIASEILIATFDYAILETRNEHLFYLGNALFGVLSRSDAVLGVKVEGTKGFDIKEAQNVSLSRILNLKESKEICTLFNLHTTSNNYIVADRQGRFYYFVHNRKWDYYYN
jgi:hypothetical protein